MSQLQLRLAQPPIWDLHQDGSGFFWMAQIREMATKIGRSFYENECGMVTVTKTSAWWPACLFNCIGRGERGGGGLIMQWKGAM